MMNKEDQFTVQYFHRYIPNEEANQGDINIWEDEWFFSSYDEAMNFVITDGVDFLRDFDFSTMVRDFEVHVKILQPQTRAKGIEQPDRAILSMKVIDGHWIDGEQVITWFSVFQDEQSS